MCVCVVVPRIPAVLAALIHSCALRTSIHCVCVCLTQLHRVMNMKVIDSPPPPYFFFFILPTGKRRLAGCSDPLISDFTHRRTWKRSLRHLQLILTLSLLLCSLLPNILHLCTHPPTQPTPPQPFLPKNLSRTPPSGLDVTYCTSSHGRTYLFFGFFLEDISSSRTNFTFCYLDHGGTVSSLLGDSPPHFTVCTVSTRCPCCLFVFLFHYISTQ